MHCITIAYCHGIKYPLVSLLLSANKCNIFQSLYQTCIVFQFYLKFQVTKKKLFLPPASQILILTSQITSSLALHLLHKSLG